MKKRPLSALAFFAFLTFSKAQNDVRAVREGNFFGFQNAKNEWVIEAKYARFERNYCNFIIAQNAENLRGAINQKGDTLVRFEFQEIKSTMGSRFGKDKKRDFFNHFLVKKGEKWGMIDTTGRLEVPLEFDEAVWVDDSTAFFSKTGRQIMRNDLGQTVFEADFDRAALPFGTFSRTRLLLVSKNGRSGVIDFSKKMVVPLEFADIRFAADKSKFIFPKDEKGQVGCWDTEGKMHFQPQFSAMYLIADDLFLARKMDRKTGMLDADGFERLPFIFRDIHRVDERAGLFQAIKSDSLTGLFNSEGDQLTACIFKKMEAKSFLPQLVFAQKTDGQWLVLNKNGEQKSEPFDSYSGIGQMGFAAKKGEFSALFQANGQKLTDFKYRTLEAIYAKGQADQLAADHQLPAYKRFVGKSNDSGAWRLIDSFGDEHPLEPPAKTASKPSKMDDDMPDVSAQYSNEPITNPEFYPEFPGGEKALFTFIEKSLTYPEEAKKSGIKGRVLIQFIVETDGSLSNFSVRRDIGGGCGEEAVRVLKTMPRWKAGRLDGEPARVKMMVPVVFNF